MKPSDLYRLRRLERLAHIQHLQIRMHAAHVAFLNAQQAVLDAQDLCSGLERIEDLLGTPTVTIQQHATN